MRKYKQPSCHNNTDMVDKLNLIIIMKPITRFFLISIFSKNIICTKTLSLQSISNLYPDTLDRRAILSLSVQGTVLTNTNFALATSLNPKEGRDLQNYVYSENWIGSSLPILSLEQAASQKENHYEMGRWPDPILRRKANKIEEDMIGSILVKKVAQKLRTTARINMAVGLAAQQWLVSVLAVILFNRIVALNMSR